MKKLLAGLILATLCYAAPSHAVTCNDPSGFLKTDGPIPLGDILILGPDCQHAQDGGSGGSQGFSGNSDLIVNGGAQIDQLYEGSQNTLCDGTNSALPGGAPTTEIYVLDNWRLGCDSGAGRLSGKQTQLNFGTTGVPQLFNFVDLKNPTVDTSTTATNNYHLEIPITGDRIARLQFGTANASPVTCQFWFAASSIFNNGVFGIGLVEGVSDAQGVVETFKYTGNGLGQQFFITFPGATTGAWTANKFIIGLKVIFDLGSGSQFQASAPNVWQNGPFFSLAGLTRFIATSGEIFITGLQCDPGTIALPYRIASYTQDLANCEAYVFKTFPIAQPVSSAAGAAGALSYTVTIAGTATGGSIHLTWPTQNSAAPSIFTYSPGNGNTKWRNASSAADSGAPTVLFAGSSGATFFNPQVAADAVQQAMELHVVAVSRTGTF